ncbi:hypothetical protein Pla175_02640 [Pirellulimonas nuda]|uniref:Uncharacterized protein n=2 Tax=Pirellulimonas nuda TaxID=2528009 RepID=A0A518D619_9BACT|nr:hypothetical protein Pla175_02640 [Pirellulimonas nuda]
MTIQWPDEQYGNEGLTIDIDGHCSRNMPIRSGHGPPDFVELQRGYLRIRFEPGLAKRLELDEEITVQFDLDEEDFQAVNQFVENIGGPAPEGR